MVHDKGNTIINSVMALRWWEGLESREDKGIHSYDNYLLHSYYMPRTVLKDIVENK